MISGGEPALPDRSPSTSPATFNWPCVRREAHGPHPRKVVGVEVDGDVVFESKTTPPDAPRVYLDGHGRMTYDEDCPGVKAHPNTMIGRK